MNEAARMNPLIVLMSLITNLFTVSPAIREGCEDIQLRARWEVEILARLNIGILQMQSSFLLYPANGVGGHIISIQRKVRIKPHNLVALALCI